MTRLLAGVAVLIVLVVRPLAGAWALAGHPRSTWPERWFIGFFGIRGIGSLYYLSYAVRRAEFPGEDALWAVVVQRQQRALRGKEGIRAQPVGLNIYTCMHAYTE